LEKRKIGSLEVSVVGLGCNNFGKRLGYNETVSVIDAAIEAGINFFDTADVYGGTNSEEFIGGALLGRRNEVLIATKFGSRIDDARKGAKPDYVRRACDDSLKRLATDHIDLYQLHRPDPTTPITDTLGALDELVRAGKIREIGCSNFSAEQLREANSVVAAGNARFVSVQNEFSLLHREPEKEVIPECRRLGIAFIPYFPLSSGVLSGKYRKGKPAPPGSRIGSGWNSDILTDRNLETVESLIAFAKSKGHTILELAISWLARNEVVASVIAGATKPEQVRANAAAASWKLSEDEMRDVEGIVSA
jgi:aryl-alcohol dehydrogenase-like predicted oxidoreductase